MKKTFFFILILVGTAAFAFADYFFNAQGVILTPTPTSSSQTGVPPAQDTRPNIAQALLVDSESYTALNRSRVNQIFEVVDLSDLPTVAAYASELSPVLPTLDPITLYELQGPVNQGGLTYLNVKLKFINQISATATVNEVGTYGQNSFFYNNVNTPKTAYLVTQIGDNILGFKYPKENTTTFEVIQNMIQAYTASLSL